MKHPHDPEELDRRACEAEDDARGTRREQAPIDAEFIEDTIGLLRRMPWSFLVALGVVLGKWDDIGPERALREFLDDDGRLTKERALKMVVVGLYTLDELVGSSPAPRASA